MPLSVDSYVITYYEFRLIALGDESYMISLLCVLFTRLV